MVNKSALDTLIGIASAASDEAAQRMGRAVMTAENAEQKLALLLQYRDEYGHRFNQSLAVGLPAAGYQNFRNFMDKLDHAIASQQQVAGQARHSVEFERCEWQACERKRLSYDTLAVRAQKAAQQKESRRDQKQMDEHATRALLFKR